MNIADLNQQYQPLHATILCAVRDWALAEEIPVWPDASTSSVFYSGEAFDEFVKVVERHIVENLLHNRVSGEPMTSDMARDSRWVRCGLGVGGFLRIVMPWSMDEIDYATERCIQRAVSAVYKRYPPHRDEHAWEILVKWARGPRFTG